MQAATLEREQLRPVYAAEPPESAVPVGEPAPSKPRRALRAALLWGALGFFAGAIFWHAVGFWTFVSEVVLDSEGSVQFARQAATRPGALAHPELPVIYLIDPASCTALELDRTANRTAVRPCPREGLALRWRPAAIGKIWPC
jgi:hypothetical protein